MITLDLSQRNNVGEEWFSPFFITKIDLFVKLYALFKVNLLRITMGSYFINMLEAKFRDGDPGFIFNFVKKMAIHFTGRIRNMI
jgi:hypothetical protein